MEIEFLSDFNWLNLKQIRDCFIIIISNSY